MTALLVNRPEKFPMPFQADAVNGDGAAFVGEVGLVHNTVFKNAHHRPDANGGLVGEYAEFEVVNAGEIRGVDGDRAADLVREGAAIVNAVIANA